LNRTWVWATVLAGCVWATSAVGATPATPQNDLTAGGPVPTPGYSSIADELRATREQLESARAQLQQLTGEQPPPWAAAMQRDVRRSLDRVTDLQERLAARIETPLPRLDEPVVLFTVAGSTLVLGFVIGGSVQRRRSRRDRLRL